MSAKTGTCRHFTGVQHKCCEAGVNYDQFKAGLPCIKKWAKGNVCEKYLEPTPEEIAAREAEIKECIERMDKVCVAIAPWRKKHQGHNFVEVVTCPICSGRLHLSIAGGYNNHVHGYCETKGCVSWME